MRLSPEPLQSEDDINPDEEMWTHVGSYPDVRTAQEHALVVLAMGLPCWIEEDANASSLTQPADSSHHLLVNSNAADRVREELRVYARELEENSKPTSTEPSAFSHPAGWGIYLLWAMILVLVHRLQPNYPELAELGASSSTGLIADHQWWRPFTALFLHVDTEHLAGNLLSGLFFTTLVASSMGAWRGWLLILICGTLGNLATSLLVWPQDYRSIGASTAVFAALGILSGLGLAWMLRLRSHIAWLRVIAPVVGGIVVLGMTGSGQPEGNTDVMGHVFGFAAGVIAGTLYGCLANQISCRANCGTSKAGSDART